MVPGLVEPEIQCRMYTIVFLNSVVFKFPLNCLASFPGFYCLQYEKHTASDKSLGDKPGNEARYCPHFP